MEVGWFKKNSQSITRGGQRRANAYGIFDSLGNLSEYCDGYYSAEGAAFGVNRVARGGSYLDEAGDCLVSSRIEVMPSSVYTNCGVRIIRVGDDLFD